MSVNTELQRLVNAKAAIKSAISNKGVTVASTDKLDAFASKIDSIPSPDATIYSGSDAPASTLGKNGDLYIQS